MKTSTYGLKIVFLTEVLGSQSTRQITSEFIAKRAGLEELPGDEERLLPEELERGTTVFHRDETGNLLIMDYQVKGFLKESGKVLNGKVTGNVRNLRSKVDTLVFVSPRKIHLNLNGDGNMTYLERPLRAETAQGPRIALARSEMLPVGTWFKCGLTVLPGEINQEVLEDLLDYGFYKGLGQWRNGGWGSFRYELTMED